jgi:hypothetical protein
VLDRPKLEQLCCECYALVNKETDRLLRVRTRASREDLKRVPPLVHSYAAAVQTS